MVWTRRQFLSAAGAGFATSLAPRSAEALAGSDLVFASAGKLSSGAFAVALFNERGEMLASLPLPARGHDITQCKITGRLVAFARRPGTFAIVFERTGTVRATITSAPGRHFFGHGLFTADGKLLYATENAYDSAEGKIGIYDATDKFQRLGELPTYGMDPHDIVLSRDGKTLCVANGGIETHPDYGRTELNLPTMQPSLVFIDAATGDLIAKHQPPAELHQLSLRHISLGTAGRIWVGGQFKGDQSSPVPLLASGGPDEPLRFAELPEAASRHLAFYVGSVAASPDGTELVATSPIGNTALHLDTASGAAELLQAESVCGVDWAGDGFAHSTGQGALLPPHSNAAQTDFLFDNHLLSAN